jgi:Putative adhesin
MKARRLFSLAVTFAALILLLATPAPSQTTEAQEEHFARTFAVNPDATLAVDNYKGTIHVTGTDNKQISVRVEKKFEGSDSDRKWWMANTHVNFENDPTRVRVAVQYPNSHCFVACDSDEHSDYTAAVELTIQVPRHTKLDLSGYKPDVKVSAIEGDLRIHSYKSPMNVESTIGSIDISTYKESVHLHDVSVRGPLRLKMYKGEATLEAKSLGDEVNIETEKGSVALVVPRTAGLTVDYSGGRRANFHSDLPITSTAGFGGDEIRGTINGGGTRLRLRTEKGSISLESMR